MFNPDAFKLIRTLYGLSLDEVAGRIQTTRQYVHAVENGLKQPTDNQISIFCIIFGVKRGYFSFELSSLPCEEDVHFRKLRSTRQSDKAQTIARLGMVEKIIDTLENELNLPAVNFPSANQSSYTSDQINQITLKCRKHWGLGLSPIVNMNRLAESNGAFVLDLDKTVQTVDALSLIRKRPIILRNTAKESICRKRFDIAHEIGHFILHRGKVTGDRQTEQEANFFASCLLLPEKAILEEFPRPVNGRFNWKALSTFKLKWKASKAACLYRAHKMGLISDAQYKNAVITLRCRGEAITEQEDCLIPDENPELIHKALSIVSDDGIDFLSKKLAVAPSTVKRILSLRDNNNDARKIISFPI